MRRLIKIVRNILLLVVAGTVVLAGVLLFNVVTHGSRQIEVAAVPRAPVDQQGAAARLSEAIRFQTISSFLNPEQDTEALRGLRAHIEKSFPAFHAAARREVLGGYSLLYSWEGADPKAPPIALLAHQDVVPVAPGTEKDWQHPPYDGAIADGFIWGRGSWDDKGNLYSMLEAAEQMAKAGFRPKRTVYFAFGHDEEVAGVRGAKVIAATLASRGVKHDVVLDEGLLITEGIRPRQAGRLGRRCREGLCDAGPDSAFDPRPFLNAAARDRDRHDERGAGAAGRPSPTDAGSRRRGGDVRHDRARNERLQPRRAVQPLAVQAAGVA
jgi:carboxypeptidase PM20D1